MKNITGKPLKSEPIEAEACMDYKTSTEMKEGGWYEVWQVLKAKRALGQYRSGGQLSRLFSNDNIIWSNVSALTESVRRAKDDPHLLLSVQKVGEQELQDYDEERPYRCLIGFSIVSSTLYSSNIH